MLETDIAGVRLKTPVIAASGTFGYGREYADLIDVSALGGVCTKGLTLRPRTGNNGVRLWETPSGLLNSIGLENPGIPAFIEKELPAMKQLGTVIIANLSGSDMSEYAEGAQLLDKAEVDIVELNISCPNVKQGGIAFGLEAETAASVCRTVRRRLTNTPLMVKLSPNAPDIAAVARACVSAGADALSLVNTFKAMAIDIERRRPVFSNESAGLSGPAIRPLALRMVWELTENTPVPVVGIGGITRAEDALEFLMAGAAAIEVGTATFIHPTAMTDISAGIAAYMRKHRITDIKELNIRRLRNGVKLR